MKNPILLLSLIMLATAASLQGQERELTDRDISDTTALVLRETTPALIIVHRDPRLDLLVNKQIEINEITTRDSRRAAPGFRLLVISSTNRNKVLDAKTKIYQRFPELSAYMLYQAPFFKLKVGNFRERSEAEEYQADIQRLFEGSVYIVPDTIEVRPELMD